MASELSLSSNLLYITHLQNFLNLHLPTISSDESGKYASLKRTEFVVD